MGIHEALLLGVIEGLTEFLPVSSTGHLTIAEKLLGYSIDDPGVTAFTAIIQSGAVAATLLYFHRDIRRLAAAWLRGLARPARRQAADYRLAWAMIAGSIPIGIVGLTFKDQIETGLRSLWVVAAALILWSGVMWLADRQATQSRQEREVTLKDTLIIGLVQCLALIPGVSRSGATISAGLLRGLDRVTATRLSFFLAIPALLAASVLEAVTQFDKIAGGIGWTATLTGMAASFVVALASIAWLLKFVAGHNFSVFITYRLVLGAGLVLLLASGTLAAA